MEARTHTNPDVRWLFHNQHLLTPEYWVRIAATRYCDFELKTTWMVKQYFYEIRQVNYSRKIEGI